MMNEKQKAIGGDRVRGSQFVHLHKADNAKGVWMKIEDPIPNGDSKSTFLQDSDELADALFNNLPEGTLDRLLILILQRRLSTATDMFVQGLSEVE